MNYAQIQDELNSVDRSSWPKLSIAILRNITVEPIEPYLRHFAANIGCDAEVRFGAIDNIAQEALGADGRLLDGAEVVLLFTYLEGASWDLARRFTALSADQVTAEIVRVTALVADVVHGIRRRTAGLIVWHSFLLPRHPAFGALDPQREPGHRASIDGLNRAVIAALAGERGVHVVDLNHVAMKLGEARFYDDRYWHLARAPFSRQALEAIARADFALVNALKARNKKCVVLDCDNTLWGGIVGEDGWAKVRLGHTYPGSAYKEFQQELVNLSQRGVLLALCSKNNERDVLEVLDRHPDMLLKPRHIAARAIDWNDKVANLRKIASDLNIGLDALLFVDDSEFEIAMVRRLLPDVATLLLPPDRPEDYRRLLADCGLFDGLTLSGEDAVRTGLYHAEAERKQAAAHYSDVESYLRSLEMVAEVRQADAFAVPRVAQLTQKTNQFNLTTRRYTDAQVQGFVDDPVCDVLYLRLRDNFGDLGIVGAAIVRHAGDVATIDDFLLSCRALGRGAERVLLQAILCRAHDRNRRTVIGEFIPTAKNMQTSGFYASNGFTRAQEQTGRRTFEFDLGGFRPKASGYFKEITLDLAKDEPTQVAPCMTTV